MHGFNRLGQDNCKAGQETLKFWNLVRLILETLRYIIFVMSFLQYAFRMANFTVPLHHQSISTFIYMQSIALQSYLCSSKMLKCFCGCLGGSWSYSYVFSLLCNSFCNCTLSFSPVSTNSFEDQIDG